MISQDNINSPKPTITDLIAENDLFRTLSSDLKSTLSAAFEPLSIQPGTVVVAEGEPSPYFAIIASGKLNVTRENISSRQYKTADYFGFRSLFSAESMSATIVADEPSDLYVLRKAALDAAIASRPELAVALLPVVGRAAEPAPGTDAVRVTVFDTKAYQESVMRDVNRDYGYELHFVSDKLTTGTAHLAKGSTVACVFVHDDVSADVAAMLKKQGTDLVVFRCAGFDACDVGACERLGLSVARVPGYSPNAIAEHACALVLALNRRIVAASSRVHAGDFSLDGLTGFTMAGKTVGVVGTGRIGACFVRIMHGFGCKVLCYDMYRNPAVEKLDGVSYVDMDTLLAGSDIVSLHTLLDKTTFHLLDAARLAKCRRGVMIINTARGGLIDTAALVDALRTGQVGSCGLDVVEGENEYFYENMSTRVVTDDNIARLMAITNNCIITAHQAYLTTEALQEIARTTLDNIREYTEGKRMRQLRNNVF